MGHMGQLGCTERRWIALLALWGLAGCGDDGSGLCLGPDCADYKDEAAAAPPVCGDNTETFQLRPAPADIFLTIDRSPSMATSAADERVSRWDLLSGAVRELLPTLGKASRMGLLLFPRIGNARGCIESTDLPDIAMREGEAERIVETVDASKAERLGAGSTPTVTAVDISQRHLLKMRRAEVPAYLVLGTDGKPELCGDGDVSDVVRLLRDGLADGLPTFVLGMFTNDALRQSLNQFACAGGLPADLGVCQSGAGAAFFDAATAQDLNVQLRAIVNRASECRYTLKRSALGEPGLRVWLDDQEIYQGPDGWRFSDPATQEEITFDGQACTALQSGAVGKVLTRYDGPECRAEPFKPQLI